VCGLGAKVLIVHLGAEDITILAHSPTPAIAQGHHQWWRAWRGRLAELTPALRPASAGETDSGITHLFDSAGGVRVGGRLIEPARPAAGGVVVLHGYGAREDLDDRSPLVRTGLAVFKLRVRGFPGSRLDAGDLCDAPGGWIAQGLEEAETSALIGAAADVILAARALKSHLDGAPIGVRGDSLGGGLAVIAAANAPRAISRVAIGVPSLGDWTGRLLSAAPTGAGKDAREALDRAGENQGALRRTLRLSDAAVHARKVRQPALCLLATKDDVVPPTGAAAVYNALASDPGLKRRVLIERGHAEPTRDDARTLVEFERRAARLLDGTIAALDALTG